MQILIPMAGSGQRFIDAGYKTHKPVLPVFDRNTGRKLPMVVCAASDLPGVEENGNNITFIDRTFHYEDAVEDTIKKYFPGSKFIQVDKLTEGQACTCLLAKDKLDMDEELLIAGCDNGMVCDIDALNIMRHECDAIVFTYRHNEAILKNPNAYGYMEVDGDNNITGVSIKKTISDNPLNDHAVVATFWFKRAGIFIEAAEKMIAENDRVNGEFYVDQAVKYVLESGYSVKVFEIDRYICWGTPKDYEEYQLTYDYWRGFLDKVDIDRRKIVPFTIGIAGDSGSGKSTFLSVIEKVTGKDNLLVLEGDGEHKWERASEAWKSYTHLDADANNLYKQASNLQLLKNGSAIKRHEYDHRTGKFTEDFRYAPKPYVALCGLHAFFLPQSRKNLDLMIYMDIDENLRRFWKIRRDILSRGRNFDEILSQIDDRKEDVSKYVEPQKRFADVIIRYFDPLLSDYGDLNYKENVHVEVVLNKEDTICGSIYRLLQYLKTNIKGIKCESEIITFLEDEIKEQRISIYEAAGEIGLDVKKIGITEKDDFYGAESVFALILMAYISEKMQDD